MRCLHALCALSPAKPACITAWFVMDFAGGTAAALAMTGGPQPGGPAVLGPDLWEDMGEQAFVESLNALSPIHI